MMSVVTYVRQSLAARLSFWVFASVVVLFMAALGIMFYYSRLAVKEEAIEKASQTLEGTMLRVGNTLHEVEVAANNMKWLVEQHIDEPDSMFVFSRKILENNPHLIGCSIAFDPFFYEEWGQYFSAYSYNGPDSIQTEQEGTDIYQYYYLDWYLIPKLLDKPYWVEPFIETETGGLLTNEAITSFCQPIRDKQGNSVGILSVDLSLDWFSHTIADSKPFPHSYSILVGKGGTFLVHPDSTKLFYQTIFTSTLEHPDTAMTAIGKAMISGEAGYRSFQRDGETYYVFYRPFIHTDWSVAIVCEESDIVEPFKQLQTSLMIITVVGLVLLLFFCVLIIRHNLRPLKRLARSARHISGGNFDEKIPDSKRRDEVGHLQHSFSMMQKSLSDYINELRNTTDTLTERNNELVKASKLAKEDDRAKSAVINNMTDQMVEPVRIIVTENEAIRKGYKEFTSEEMAGHVDRMLENTENVTRLLNEILDASERAMAYHGPEHQASTGGDNTTMSNPENAKQ